MKCLLFYLLVFTTALQAQTIKGRVTDLQSNQSLAFVTVVEDGTQNGTYSDIDGYFSITLIQENTILVFS